MLCFSVQNKPTYPTKMNTSIVRSDNHNKYGSTGTTPITTAQYTIFILHNGQSTSQAFSAKALSTETVDDLKKLIKIVRSPALDRIPADKLKLVRVDIPDDPATESRPVCFQHLAIVRPLRATELLRDVFPEPPEQGKIHVVIESAEPVASSAVMTPRAHGDKDFPWVVLLLVCGMLFGVVNNYIGKLPGPGKV